MATNTILTIDMITKEALRVLHNNLSFAKNIDRQYDSQFAKEGAKIGSALRIRKPARYTVSTGATLVEQNYTEETTTLNCSTQKHVGLSWTSSEMTLSLDEFSARVLKPAMSVLAASIDSDALSMYKNIYNQVGTPGTTPASVTTWLQAGQKLDEFTAPRDGDRNVVMSPAAQASTVAALSGLFNNTALVGEQYKKGQMGQGLGFNFFMDQAVNSHTTGGRATATALTTTDVSTDTSAIKIKADAGTWLLKVGDVFTLAGVYAVNPETKTNTGSLQQFVVVSETTANTTGVMVSVSPAITTTGATQTVSGLPADGAAATFASGSAATAYPQNLAFHKDAFTLATADLILPTGVDMASRQVFDGISLRIVRQYDVVSDKMRCRADVLYGYLAQRPEFACRVTG